MFMAWTVKKKKKKGHRLLLGLLKRGDEYKSVCQRLSIFQSISAFFKKASVVSDHLWTFLELQGLFYLAFFKNQLRFSELLRRSV